MENSLCRRLPKRSVAPHADYRDIAKWARTSPAMIATFYDQTHPQLSVERIVGFRKVGCIHRDVKPHNILRFRGRTLFYSIVELQGLIS